MVSQWISFICSFGGRREVLGHSLNCVNNAHNTCY